MSFIKIFSPNLGLLSVILLLFVFTPPTNANVQLKAHLSQSDVRGEVVFSQSSRQDPVVITLNLTLTDEVSAGEYSWGIYEFPIDYSASDYCHTARVGRRPIINLDSSAGKFVLPATSEDGLITLEATDLALHGQASIWGTSLILEGPSKRRICGTILPEVQESDHTFNVAEARFYAPIAGSVFFFKYERDDEVVETKILSNLYTTENGPSTRNNWQLFHTYPELPDVQNFNGNCDFLSTVLDTDETNNDSQDCSAESPDKCKEGDLTSKFGQVSVGRSESMFSRKYYNDLRLNLQPNEAVFLVVYDSENPDRFLTCARLHWFKPKVAKATLAHDGIRGKIEFEQKSPFHPVVTQVDLQGLHKEAGSFHVHQLPVPNKLDADDTPCSRTAGHFNPFSVDPTSSPEVGGGSFDKYEVGDLSGKYGSLAEQDSIQMVHVDPNLSLFGKHSILGRSIVIHRTPIPKRWVCANIEPTVRMTTVVAQFTYPVAGRIIFSQEEDSPQSDTTVYVESLLYSDGTKNDTQLHKWHVHVDKPGKDYFNWTGRCLSAGPHFNPYQINTDNVGNDCASGDSPFKCEIGDLVNKLGHLSVAGRKRDVYQTSRLMTDTSLPLSGFTSIQGHSIVIHDDHAPEHRGNRMACTALVPSVWHRLVAKDWFGNGDPVQFKGRLEFLQFSDRSFTQSLVQLEKLFTIDSGVSGFHVHRVPVQPHLALPCTAPVVGGHYNPFGTQAGAQLPEATPDQFEVGDLSGKYGSLYQKRQLTEIYNDTNLPLFGPNSIAGRSIVLHRAKDGYRSACATLGWGYDPDEARELRAIASFHHPQGFAWGYVRFSQVVYGNGATSDTTIEVRLKYPGKFNNKRTSNHRWAIYVNPVGHDAAVKFFNARCTAAGYRWNPTLIQLADPNDHSFYEEQCGADQPLRCEVGDLSGRHGPIALGGEAFIFNDVNLPLSGDWFVSALGKSVVIHTPDDGADRMACANIEEDHHIIKSAHIFTRSDFSLSSFMEEVQAVMGVPEWFFYPDLRASQEASDGLCIRIKLHITGPHAHKIEQDFDRLMRTGRADSPSIAIPGYVPDPQRKTKVPYRYCDSIKDAGQASNTQSSGNNLYDIYSSLTGYGSSLASSGLVVSSKLLASALLLVMLMTRQWLNY